MAYDLDDTIVAIASAPGPAARGIVRLSGPDSHACVARFFQPAPIDPAAGSNGARVVSGVATLPDVHASLPCDTYLWPGVRSYTRQPSVEIHTLGSPPLLDALVHAACTYGARPARPGEFTLRAFLAGRLDFTQAEAVLGVINAAEGRELDVALSQLAGGLAGPLDRLRDELLDLLARVEAGLDFVEEDIEFVTTDEIECCLSAASAAVSELLARMSSRGATRDTVRAVLVGSPNVGKSSLFNALLGDAAAIVSESAGTTRDFLTGRLKLDGIACQLIDTAGVHTVLADGTSPAGQAQRLAAQQHATAHLRILCLDSGRALNDWERSEMRRDAPPQTILVLTKCDRPRAVEPIVSAVATSSFTGQGLDQLRRRLREAVESACHVDADVVAETAVRCHDSLRRTSVALLQARELLHERSGDELVAAEIRLALDELGQITGAVYNDDVLDRIFSRFCIGK